MTGIPTIFNTSDYENLIDLISESDLEHKYKEQPVNDFQMNETKILIYAHKIKEVIKTIIYFTV